MAGSRDRETPEATSTKGDPSAEERRSAALVLPSETTPTWEVELLISGVAVFSMLQLPGWLDDRFFELLPRLGAGWTAMARLLYIYSKSAALILGATFVLHLLLRAHWIALVGMHSVYPEGVRWERLRIGPAQRLLARQRLPDMPTVIERADNRSTTVFAFGVSLATILLVVSVGVVGVFAVGSLVAWWLGTSLDPDWLAAGVLILVSPLLLANLLDRRLGDRLDPQRWPHRTLRKVFSVYSRVGMGRSGNAIMALMTSRGGEARAVGLTVFLMLIVLASAIGSYAALRDPMLVGSYQLFPRSKTGDPLFVDPAHYDNLRDPGRDPAVPFVQSDVPRTAYLRLLVPYRPEDDGSALRDGCPESRGATGSELRTALLDCLQQLHRVHLDGTPLADLHYELSSDPRTDRPALLAMIDLRSLAPGRHELLVGRGASAGGDPDDGQDREGGEEAAAYRIPFWH